jgi:hypothetical protein
MLAKALKSHLGLKFLNEIRNNNNIKFNTRNLIFKINLKRELRSINDYYVITRRGIALNRFRDALKTSTQGRNRIKMFGKAPTIYKRLNRGLGRKRI